MYVRQRPGGGCDDTEYAKNTWPTRYVQLNRAKAPNDLTPRSTGSSSSISEAQARASLLRSSKTIRLGIWSKISRKWGWADSDACSTCTDLHARDRSGIIYKYPNGMSLAALGGPHYLWHTLKSIPSLCYRWSYGASLP